jgi:predicted TIM-barrel fold metal-dependent hydrolase
MAKRYPNAILILAHAARSYADWPAVEAAQYIADLDNVWADLSAIFFSPPAFQLIKKLGVSRCMWGTDFPICNSRFGAITVARNQYWYSQKILDCLGTQNWSIGTQTLMAIRQAAIMAELTPAQVEDIFYNNAMRLFHGK